MPRSSPRRVVGAILVVAALLAAACDPDDDNGGNGSASTTTDATAEQADGDSGTEPSTSTTGTSPDDAASTTTAPEATGGRDLVAFDGVSLDPAACLFVEPDEQSPECYWLTVPQDWNDPDETDGVRLHVAVYEGADADAAPLVYLEGGPGRTKLEAMNETFGDTVAPFLGAGDVVIFDQRGTGLSRPALECPELVDVTRALNAPSTPVDFDRAGPIADAAGACAEKLDAAGIELENYNSLASAADTDALRDALGIDQWNVYGLRYGTRLAQTYLRDHGPTIRSVVLDGAYAIDADPIDITDSGAAAIDQLFASCAADAGCAARFPDLAQRFDALVEKLDAEPLEIRSADIGSGGFLLKVDGTYLYDTVVRSLQAAGHAATVPRMIEQIENGDSTIIEVLAALEFDRENALSYGQHLSVMCNEEAPFSDGVPDRFYEHACAVWESGTAPALEDEALTSDVPALILAGEFDPVTRPEASALIADGLSASHVVDLPGLGSGSLGDDCADSVILSFLADPASAPDTSCVAAMTPPVYVTGDVGTIALEPIDVDFFGADVTTVAPVGWDFIERAGGFIRMRDVLDPTGIFTLAIPETDVAGVVDRLQNQGNFAFIAAPSLEAGGRTWERYDGVAAGDTLTLAGTIEDGTTIIVMLEALPDERDELFDEVMLPVLDGISVTVPS